MRAVMHADDPGAASAYWSELMRPTRRDHDVDALRDAEIEAAELEDDFAAGPLDAGLED